MKIKDFEIKYGINFDNCFTYDALIKASQKFAELPPLFNEDDSKNAELTRVDFVKDFMTLEVN